jgi:hypothetical protein
MIKPILLLTLVLSIPFRLLAQDPDLLDMLDKEDKAKPVTDYATATLKLQG